MLGSEVNVRRSNARYIQRFEDPLRNLPLQSSTTVVACRDGFVEAEIDGEILALSIEQGTCYGMNQVGSRIWNLLVKPMRICDLCAALLAAYRVDPDVCERQVLDLLEELRAEGMIATLEEK
jgi:hypothetical protein